MKHKQSLLILLIVIFLITASASLANSAGYLIDRWTVDGGGGSSSGGNYSLSAAAGQPDAGTLTSPQYSLAGGFWVGPAQYGGKSFIPVVVR